jgi:hypothetical protein
MRLPTLILSCAAAALIAAGAGAQDPAPEQAPDTTERAEPGLSDLSATVETLSDDPPAGQAEPAAPDAAAQPVVEEPVVEEPVQEEPEAAPEPVAAPPPEQTPTPAPTPGAAPAPLTRAQRDALLAASQRGRLLGVIAGAGQIATRDMLSRLPNPGEAGISGWIAEPAGNGLTVTFYADGEGEAAPRAVYRTAIVGGRVTSRETFLTGERPPLGGLVARMAAARRAAAAQAHRPCGGDQFNYFVVPPATLDGPIDVYQISPQTARGRYPVGGHFKTIVAADGSIAETRGYTNSCLDVVVPEVAAGSRPPPLAITHLMDPLPTEIHGFLAVWTGRPLLVVADDPQRLFAVTAEGMAEVPR